MSVSKKTEYLNNLSSFWLDFYEDADLIDNAMGATAEVIKNHYFRVLQKNMPLPLQKFPVFREEFWNVVELIADDAKLVTRQGVQYFMYPLDEEYARIPMLYNIIYKPTVRLKESVDYRIVRETSNLDRVDIDATLPKTELIIKAYILFKRKTPASNSSYNGDPFTHNDIAKRVKDDGRISIAFYAPKSYLDSQDLFKEYGSIVDIRDKSSEEYKAFLTGVYRLYIKGPTIANMNAGLNLAAGYPIARQEETITSVEIYEDSSRDINEFILSSDQGNTYTIPRFKLQEYDRDVDPPVLKDIILPNLVFNGIGINPDFSNPLLPAGVYSIYHPVSRLDSFISDLKIVDNNTEPKWWRNKSGTLAGSFLEGVGLTPDQNNTLLKDTETQDYLFETYLKFNTFGVFIDFRVLRNEIRVLGDFIDLLSDVKPTNKAFLIFENDLQALTVMTKGDTKTNNEIDPEAPLDYGNGVSIGFDFFIEELRQISHVISMGLPFSSPFEQYSAAPIEIGMSLETVRHCYMATGFTVSWKGDLTGGPSSKSVFRDTRPLILGSGTSTPDTPLELGCYPNDQVWEHVTLQVIISPILDTPVLGSDANGNFVELFWTPEGDYDNFLIYKNGVPLGMTGNLSYKDYSPFVVGDEYQVVTMYQGFMSSLSDVTTAPVAPAPAIFFDFSEGVGSDLNDTSGENNDGTIINYSSTDPAVFFLFSENSGTALNDFSLLNNDGSLVTDAGIALNEQRIFFDLVEGSGSSLADSSVNNNDGTITVDSGILITPIGLEFLLLEGTGTTLNDNTINNNDGTIVP